MSYQPIDFRLRKPFWKFDAKWDENKHPRDGGKFAPKEGASGGGDDDLVSKAHSALKGMKPEKDGSIHVEDLATEIKKSDSSIDDDSILDAVHDMEKQGLISYDGERLRVLEDAGSEQQSPKGESAPEKKKDQPSKGGDAPSAGAGVGGSIAQAADLLSYYPEFQGGYIPFDELYKEVAKKHPGLTVPQFHDAVKQMARSGKAALAHANTPKNVKSPDHGYRDQDDNFVYYLKIKK